MYSITAWRQLSRSGRSPPPNPTHDAAPASRRPMAIPAASPSQPIEARFGRAGGSASAAGIAARSRASGACPSSASKDATSRSRSCRRAARRSRRASSCASRSSRALFSSSSSSLSIRAASRSSSSGIEPRTLLFQSRQRGPHGSEPAHDRADRNPQSRRRLGVGVALGVDQQGGLALGLRQSPDRC